MRYSSCRAFGIVRPIRRLAAVSAMLAIVLAQGTPAFAYLTFGVQSGDRQIPLKWPYFSVRYFVND